MSSPDIQAWLNGTMREEREENSSWDVMAEIVDEREALAALDVEPIDNEYCEENRS